MAIRFTIYMFSYGYCVSIARYVCCFRWSNERLHQPHGRNNDHIEADTGMKSFCNPLHKNLVKYTAHTVVSWLSPRRWPTNDIRIDDSTMRQDYFHDPQKGNRSVDNTLPHGPLTKYAKLRVAYMRQECETKPPVNDPGMHHNTCVTHVPWCMSGSLTVVVGKMFPALPAHAPPAILRILRKRPVDCVNNNG